MLFIAFILVCYCLLVIVLWLGWKKAIQKKPLSKPGDEVMISVIVPFRDEEGTLKDLMHGLLQQHYKNFEVIAVDDHSSDQSKNVLRALDSGKLKIVDNSGSGKKYAITTGVDHASGSVIVTTDADCTVPAEWLSTIHQFFQDDKVMFLFGGVRVAQTGLFFSVLQSIEFASLIGSGAATAALGKPVMCNGANLAYRKTVFEEVRGYEDNFHVPSGDDEFLMRKIYNRYPEGIRFAGTPTAVVETGAQRDVRSFFQQRLRWASKWRYSSSGFSVLLAIFIMGSQLASLACVISLLTHVSYLALALLLAKVFVESIFLIGVCRFLNVRWNWTAFVVLQLIYPLYVIGIGIASNFLPYSWKNRKPSEGKA
jgi:poly-beta-1,6-N-acetyl-D-glucosamine synthase